MAEECNGAAPIVRLASLRKDYGDRVVTHAVDGVDFTLCPGEFTALMGPSGSGKSTLLNLIGLLDRPTAGRVMIRGRDTSGLGDDELTRLRAREIGFVFQFHHLLPAFTALENVIIPGLIAGRSRQEMIAPAQALLEQVELGHRLHGAENIHIVLVGADRFDYAVDIRFDDQPGAGLPVKQRIVLVQFGV